MFGKRRKKSSYFSLREINPVIRILTISDVMILGGFGLVSPIFAIYITDSIIGGSIEVVGIASMIYLLVKSLGQIPIAFFIDKLRGERDDFWMMFFGSILFGLAPFLYIYISTPIQLYFVQFLYGLGAAMSTPTWYAIFTKHIDKNKEGVEWGMYSTMVDIGSAGTASLGAFLAALFGFEKLFLVVGVISLIGSFYLLLIYNKMYSGKFSEDIFKR